MEDEVNIHIADFTEKQAWRKSSPADDNCNWIVHSGGFS